MTSVTLYTQLVAQMIWDYYINSPQFQSITTASYTAMSYLNGVKLPNVEGFSQLNYAGGAPGTTGGPWALFLGNYATGKKLYNWYAFKQQNGG